MKKANYSEEKGFSGLFVGLFAKLFSPFKISFIVGSYTAFFSLTGSVLPLVGAFSSMPTTLAFFFLSMTVRYAMAPIAVGKLCAFFLPGMCASLVWHDRYDSVRVIIPFVCMALFMMHPVGGQAWTYALYWVIPIALYAASRQGIVAKAVSSTFVAHAVGSVIWLYAYPMTAAVWIGLIPVVALERLLFASSMVLVYNFVFYIKHYLIKNRNIHTYIHLNKHKKIIQ